MFQYFAVVVFVAVVVVIVVIVLLLLPSQSVDKQLWVSLVNLAFHFIVWSHIKMDQTFDASVGPEKIKQQL